MREFNKFDWYGFAGAEETADKRQPLINEKQNPLEIIVIVDKGGVSISRDTDDGYTAFWNFGISYDAAILIAPEIEKRLESVTSIKELEEKVLEPFDFVNMS